MLRKQTETKCKPFHSIRAKLTFTLMCVMGIWMLLTWLMCMIFLEKFYMQKVEQILKDSYNTINKMVGDSDDVYTILSKNYYTDNNIDVVIGTFVNNTTVNLDYSTSSEGYMGYSSMEKLFQLAANVQASEGEEWQFNDSYEEKEKGTYILQKNHDNHTSSDYLNLIGTLDNGHVIVIQTPVESIRRSAMISNTFLGYIGIFVTLLGCLFMFFISNNYSRPIHQMAVIAKRMSDLDFKAKVSHFSNDEIGELGHSMNDLADKLEMTISELKTANNELRKDIDRKTQIDEMRKEFLSHVSHELKTPIALVQGYAEGLKDNILDDEESKEFYCDVIIDEADKMNKMVRKLLALNELEFGTDQVQIEHFNLSELIKNVVEQSGIMIQKQNADVRLEIDPDIWVWADEFKIEAVVTNYLTNALNHLSKDGYILINMVRREHDVRVYVYNTGEPIPEEDIDKLWIKFYKVDKARTREYGGNGIGLSIVAATMQAHGKDYGVENVEDGVRFYFDLDTENDTNCDGCLEEKSQEETEQI